jgi:hypothetical protein
MENRIEKFEASRNSFYTWVAIFAVVWLAGLLITVSRGYLLSAVVVSLGFAAMETIIAMSGRLMRARGRRIPTNVQLREGVLVALMPATGGTASPTTISIPFASIVSLDGRFPDLLYIPPSMA